MRLAAVSIHRAAAVLALGVLPLAAAAQAVTIDQLAWLAGCWRAERGEPGTEEHWLAPAGGAMLGVARTLRGGAMVAYEFMRIEQRADGSLVYAALPSGRAETVFTLRAGGSAQALVFENPGHDFPQRVIYRLAAPGRLQARIEGQPGGQGPLRGVDFPMQRVGCERP